MLDKHQSLLAPVTLCPLNAQFYSQSDYCECLAPMKDKGRCIIAQLSWLALNRCVTSLCLDFFHPKNGMDHLFTGREKPVGSEDLECASL